MKKIPTSLLSATSMLALAQLSQAAVINFPVTDWNGNSTSISGFSISSEVVDTDDMLYTFTTSGDLDGGTLDDTFTFQIRLQAFTGSTSNGTNVTLGTTSVDSNQVAGANTNFTTPGNFGVGESLVFTIESTNWISGEGDSSSIVFNGFTSFFTAGASGAQDWAVGETDAEYFSVNRFNNPTFTATDTRFVLSSFTDPAVTSSIRAIDSSFTVTTTAVPEPSSVALLGLGFGALALRRRRA